MRVFVSNQGKFLLSVVFSCGFASVAVCQGAASADAWKAACEQLKTYAQTNDSVAPSVLVRHLSQATPEQRAEVEAVFLKLLSEPQTSDDAKRFICRQGAYMKADESVMLLVGLQSEPMFSYAACYGLLQHQNKTACPALRAALGQRTGRPLVEAVRTLGEFREQASVSALAGLLNSSESDVARAAVVALGKIGGAEAEAALESFEPQAEALRECVAEARLACAQKAGGAQAARLCKTYLQSPCYPLRAGAFAILLKAEPEQRSARLNEAIRGNDAALKTVAYVEARRGGDAELTKALAETLGVLPPEEQALLLGVLRDRGDGIALPAVLKRLESQDAKVRKAAYAALGVLGGSEQVDSLLAALISEKAVEVQSQAREALVRLRGRETDAALVERASEGPLARRKEAVGALAARAVVSTTPALMKLAEDADADIRKTAIRGLIKTASINEYGELIRRVLATASEADRLGYQTAAAKVYGRSKEPEKCVVLLLATVKTAQGQPPAVLLDVLAGTGAPEALALLTRGLESSDVEERKAALRAFPSWPDCKPVTQLIATAQQAQERSIKVLAIRAGVQLLSKDVKTPGRVRVGLLEELFKLAERAEERHLIVGALGDMRCAESLDVAVKLTADDEQAEAAVKEIVELAKRLNSLGLQKSRVKTALLKAAATKTTEAAQQSVQAELKKL